MPPRKPVRPTPRRPPPPRPQNNGSEDGSEEQTSSPDPLDVISNKSSASSDRLPVYKTRRASQQSHSSPSPAEGSRSSTSQRSSIKRSRVHGDANDNGDRARKTATFSDSASSGRQSSQGEVEEEGLDEWATFLSDSDSKRRRSSGQSSLASASNSTFDALDQTHHIQVLNQNQHSHPFQLSPVRRRLEDMTADESLSPIIPENVGMISEVEEQKQEETGERAGLEHSDHLQGLDLVGTREHEDSRTPADLDTSGIEDAAASVDQKHGNDSAQLDVQGPAEPLGMPESPLRSASTERVTGNEPEEQQVHDERPENALADIVSEHATDTNLPRQSPPIANIEVDKSEIPVQEQTAGSIVGSESEIAIVAELPLDSLPTDTITDLDSEPMPDAQNDLPSAEHIIEDIPTTLAVGDGPRSPVKEQTPAVGVEDITSVAPETHELVEDGTMEVDQPTHDFDHAASSPASFGEGLEEAEEELDEEVSGSPEKSEAEVDADGDVDMEESSTSVLPPSTSTNGGKPKSEKQKPGPKPKSGVTKKVDPAIKKTSKDTKTKGKVNDLKASAKSKTARFAAESTESADGVRQGTPDTTNDRVWCVCRIKESEDDDEVTMVGCESCDDWFHPKCVGLTEDQVAKLDVYICRSCERSTKQKTAYKKSCKRDGCEKGLGDRESKFCSDLCAYKHMKAFTDSITNKKTMKQLSTSFVSYPKPAAATIHHHSVAPPAAASSSTQELINTIQAQLVSTRAALDIVLRRQQILQAATDRADSLPPVVVQAEETRSSKSKRKAGGGPTEDKQCAWDARLIWDDQDVIAWDGNEREDREICGLPKRKCDRHQGWPKTATISLELEHAQLAKQEKALVKQETEVTKASAAQEESDQAKTAFHQRLVAKGKTK